MPTFEGRLSANSLRFGIIVARFNQPLTERLLHGAVDCLKKHGASDNDIAIAWVPGSFELPLLAKRFAESKKFDAIICLGALIRGATAHFDYVSSQTASGIMNVGLSTGVPTIFGVLTTENVEQAEERAGLKGGNMGFQWALSAIEMATLLKSLS